MTEDTLLPEKVLLSRRKSHILNTHFSAAVHFGLDYSETKSRIGMANRTVKGFRNS